MVRTHQAGIIFLSFLIFSCAGSTQRTTPDKTLKQIDGEEIIPLRHSTIQVHLPEVPPSEKNLQLLMDTRLKTLINQSSVLRVVSDQEDSDLILLTKAKSIVSIPLHYDSFHNPVSEKIEAAFRVMILPGKKDPSNAPPQERTVICRTDFVFREAPWETRLTAMERLSEICSQRIVMTVFHGWYSGLKSYQELGYDPLLSEKEAFLEQVIPREIPSEQREQLLKQYNQYFDEVERNALPRDMEASPFD